MERCPAVLQSVDRATSLGEALPLRPYSAPPRARPEPGPKSLGARRRTLSECHAQNTRTLAAREGYGLQTSRRHQLRGRVVCPRQKKTVAASAGYGTGCSSSAPSSALRSAAGLSGGDAPSPDPRSASCPGAPGLAGDAPAATARPGAGAPRGTRTSSAASAPSVMVAAGSTCGGQAMTGPQERQSPPPQAERSCGNRRGRRDVFVFSY